MTGNNGLRVLRLHGPAVKGQPSLWSGDFDLSLVPESVLNGDGLVRHFSLRLQTMAAARSRLAWPGHFDVPFHEPALFDATLSLDRDGGHGGGVVHVLDATERFRTDPVAGRIRPLDDGIWPDKQTQQIEAPDMRLVAGEVSLALAPGERNLCSLFNMRPLGWIANRPEQIFGPGISIDISARIRAEAKLVPDGIVFELKILDPFRGIVSGAAKADDPPHELTVLLYPAADETKNPPGTLFRLRLLEDRHGFFSRSFAAYLTALSAANAPLAIDIASGVPPIEWPVTRASDGKLKADSSVMLIRRDDVGATLLTGIPPRSLQRGAAVVMPYRTRLIRHPDGNSVKLVIDSGSRPGANVTRCDLDWQSGAKDTTLKGLGIAPQPTSTTADLQPFGAVAETDAVRERLVKRYAAGKLRDVASVDPVYAFIPLQRGLLQAPLPRPAEPAQPSEPAKPLVSTPRREAMSGFIHVRNANGSALVDITSAAHVSITATLNRTALAISIAVSDFLGTVTGPLRVAETIPVDGEVLPSLANGPAASTAMAIKVGQQSANGWNVLVDPLGVAEPGLRIAGLTGDANGTSFDDDGRPIAKGAAAIFVAWLAHGELALVSAMSMTQLGSAAHRVSRTRDLVPVQIGLDRSNKPQHDIHLDRQASSYLPRLAATGLGTNMHGWPRPAPDEPVDGELTTDEPNKWTPGVPLVPLTLPGIELGPNQTGNDVFGSMSASLRFDLPVLGELFADATLKRAAVSDVPAIVTQAAADPALASQPADQNIHQATARPVTAIDPQALEAAWKEQADKLARTRTVLDRITPWSGAGGSVKITGLAEPYSWTTTFGFDVRGHATSDLPLGLFTLGGTAYFGSAALAGLTQNFAIQAGQITPDDASHDIEVVGMAAKMRDVGTALVDMRGLGLAKAASRKGDLVWREMTLEGTAGAGRALASFRAQCPGNFGLSFEARDLPMIMSPLEANFSADLSEAGHDPEGRIGADGRMFIRANLAGAPAEWRLFETGAPRPRFTVPLGPFRLRPLRLLEVKISPSNGPVSFKTLKILGSVELDTIGGDGDMPFDDDAPYASGNLVALRFDDHGLAGIERVTIDLDGPKILVEQQPVRIVLTGRALVAQGGAARQSVALDFALGVAARVPICSDVNLRVRLFGQNYELRDGRFAAGASPAFPVTWTFRNEPQPNALTVDRITLGFAGGEPVIDIAADIRLASVEAGARTKAGPVLLALAISPDMTPRAHCWFDTNLAADQRLAIDHDRGMISLNEATWQCPAINVLRGLTLRSSTGANLPVTGTVALAVALTGEEDRVSVASNQAFACPIAAGLTVFETGDASAGSLRQTMRLKWDAATKKLVCEARTRLSLPRMDRQSTIGWPVGLQRDELSTARPLIWTFKIAPGGLSWTHKVDVNLTDADLPASILGRDSHDPKSPLFLRHAWRVRAASMHSFVEGGATKWQFQSLDEVALFDLRQLVVQARRDADRPLPDYDVDESSYAFVPRYRNEAKLKSNIVAAGIVRRGMARAGFPTRAIQATLADLDPAGASALVMTGATLVDVSFQAGQGVALPLPWIVVAGSVPALNIAQRPQAGASISCRVSTQDADPARTYVGGAGEIFPAASRSVIEIAAMLAERVGSAPLPFIVADQAFSTDGEDMPARIPGNPHAPADRYDRPVFWRAATAIDWIAKRLAENRGQELQATTVLGGPGHVSLGMRLRVGQGPALQLPASSDRQLVVIGRGPLFEMSVPAADLELSAAQAGDVDRVMVHAYSRTPAPLAVVTADYAGVDEKTAPLAHARMRVVPISATTSAATALRSRTQWLPASPSLGWPQAREAIVRDPSIKLGAEQPIQDKEKAWSGRARAFAVARQAAKGQQDPIYLAFGRKTLFRRRDQRKDPTVAPPDLALSLLPPRARAPLQQAIRDAINPGGGGGPISDGARQLSAYLPGGIEMITTGGRAGVVGIDHLGLIVPGADTAFDEGFARFGRPAHRGPSIAQNTRNPRSSSLPLTGAAIDWRRRTFAAQNFVENGELTTFLATAGSMAMLRYLKQDELYGVALIVAQTEAEIGPGWDGTLGFSASAPKETNIADVLAQRGIREKVHPGDVGTRIDLVVGTRSFPFDRIRPDQHNAGGFVLKLADDQIIAAQTALREAAPDTAVRLSFRLSPEDTSATWPTRGNQPQEQMLVAGGGDEDRLRRVEARVVTLPLLLANDDAPQLSLPLRTIAFGDPAYDRELGSPTKSDSIRSSASTKTWMLATDRMEYDLGSTIYLAAGAIVEELGKRTIFEDNHADLDIFIAVQPKSIPGVAEPPDLRLLRIEGIKDPAKLASSKAVAFTIASLREARDSEGHKAGDPAGLSPGDRLVMTVVPPAGENVVPLRVEVLLVDTPVFAAPSSVYGLVSLVRPDFRSTSSSPGEWLAETSLFATAPMPDVIEFPDLLNDLAQGHVRRRALFNWNFLSASPLRCASLAKFDRTGAGQLPDDLGAFKPI
ncbi:hypothetical protein [Bradyrhizobium brasilense]|uniref:hypothetical protein n=1 Tax=Bradyrhizobium brasilense TaxID=1419277 RepID=UPI001E335508|nr:hypothetical protein [Bradyrhizobium brasilense]MCC8968925.1 hypothetical protein [Bradyrhizobium brasilense]